MSLTTISEVVIVVGWVGLIVGKLQEQEALRAKERQAAEDRARAESFARGIELIEATDITVPARTPLRLVK